MILALFTLALSPVAPARCDAGARATGARSLRGVSAALQPALAAQVLTRACTFAAPLQQALQDLTVAPKDQIPAIDRRTVSAAQAAWNAACPGGLEILSKGLALPVAQGHDEVFSGCAADRLGFATPAEFGSATGSLALPILVAYGLAEENINPVVVHDLAAALAGVPL